MHNSHETSHDSGISTSTAAAGASAASFRGLSESSPYAVLVHDRGRVVYANAAAMSLTMAESAEQMVGALITDFVHPAAILSALTASGDSGQASAPVMSVLLRRDGTTLDVEVTTVPTPWEGRAAHQTVLREMTRPTSVHGTAVDHEMHIRHAPAAIMTTTVGGVITGWNVAAERLFGRAAFDALGQPVRETLGVELDLAAVAAEGRARDLIGHTVTGAAVPVRVSVAEVDASYILICTDRTDAHDTTQHYQSVVTSLDRGIVVINRDGTIASINPAAIRILGPGAGRFPSTHAERALDYPVFDTEGNMVPSPQRPANITLRTGQPVLGQVLGLRRHDGHQSWISFTTTPLNPHEPGRSPVVMSLTDVTTEHLTALHLRHTAHHDALTGLPNRARTLAMITAAMTPSDHPRLAALMFIDIDQLKRINDSFGHHVGDLVLQACGERLQGAIRATDTLTRVGGDEFVVLVAAPASASDLHQVAQRLHHALENPVVIDMHTITISASIGVAGVDPTRPTTPTDLLRQADAAMYQAKATGLGETRFFSVHTATARHRSDTAARHSYTLPEHRS
ncbi:diguanylate cyclase domain-containing protein [Mycolicibacterium sp. CBMA 226]|uniref:diguanylate cyclase domain-containing protein n=1 Tax=Mycolicibacterium sp. CBMA 226 TaxID=2606611 RepID=UPI0012DC4B95|nr:diguanylate cyclase [Mycolicibacterium sp. CBMA 226]MUL78667.1 diguanylate cyclase [Mycolicibacterium sp. CBMA 226]